MLALVLCATTVLACAPASHEAPRVPAPVPDAEAPPAGNNWPIPPAEAERLFAYSPIELVSIKATAQGVAGATKASIRFPREGRELDVKWKTAPARSFDSWNNNPRKELAAYAVQQWFLDPRDYVVPTVALRCVPVDVFRRVEPSAKPSLEHTSCVLGTMSLWMEHVFAPDPLYEEARFAHDARYAYHFANFNLFAVLVAHRDGRPGNILVADDDANRRVFAVDNGISFDGWIYNFLTTNWNVMRVPAIRREAVERLRTVDRRKLDALGSLVELAADAEGVLRPVTAGAPIDPDEGVRVRPDRVQMGLTAKEIDAVERRRRDVLRDVDAGTLPVF